MNFSMCRIVTRWFPVVCSLMMFYFIALAEAHKRVVNQLKEQLVMVRSDNVSLFGPPQLFPLCCIRVQSGVKRNKVFCMNNRVPSQGDSSRH